MKKFLLALLSCLALAAVANVSYAQHRGSGFHGPSSFHGSGFHHSGFHHFQHGHHRFVFITAPLFWGLGFYPYLYPYPYPVTSDYLYAPLQQDYRYYCPDQGYYPSVQTCTKGWLRVVPENPPGV